MKKVYVFATLLLMAGMAMGQRIMEPKTSGSWSLSTFDHTANCSTGGVNCWSNDAATQNLVQVIPSYDHTVGTDANGCVYMYSDPLGAPKGNNTWVKQAGWPCGATNAEYGNNTVLFALTGTCSGGHYFSILNGSAQWQVWQPNYCFKSFSMDPTGSSGTAVFVDTNGKFWLSTDLGNTLSSLNGCEVNGGALSVAVLNDTSIAYECGDQSAWYGPPSGANWEQLSGVYGGHIAGADTDLYILGTDSQVYRYDLSVFPVTGQHMVSTASSYLGFDPATQTIWTITSNQPLRMTKWGIAATRTFNATTTCQGTCPNQHSNPPVHHNAYTQAKWKVKGTVVSTGTLASSGNVDPLTQVTLSSTAVLDGPIICFINSADCVYETGQETYACSQEGQLANDSSEPGDSNGWGMSVDIISYTGVQGAGTVMPFNTEIGAGGVWATQVAATTTDSCVYYTASYATCQVNGAVSRYHCTYNDYAGNVECGNLTADKFEQYLNGKPSPWIFRWPYVQTSNGPSCMPFPAFGPQGEARWGNVINLPQCQ